MEINIREDKRIVDIWLTNTEKNDRAVQTRLQPIYDKYKAKKYTVAVFESGERELYQSTLDLLTYNKKRAAQMEVQREKQQRAAGMER